MRGLIAMEGARGADIRKVFEKAMERMDECDGVVILMQKKEAGVLWFAPDNMHLQTLIFYCCQALTMFGLMSAGKM